MRQKTALAALAGALAGAGAALLLRRGAGALGGTPALPDPRAEELRAKLAEARRTHVEEDDFEAAGMGAETTVAEDPPPPRPERPPADEFEAMRRRVHEEGRAAAEEMRRRGDGGET